MTNYHLAEFEKWLGSDALSVLLGDSTREAGTINHYVKEKKEVDEFLTALISETKFSNKYAVWEFDNQEWVEKKGWKNVQAKGKQWVSHIRRERERAK